MKHPFSLTAFLLVVFALSQVIGLLIVSQYVDAAASEAAGETVYEELPLGVQRPEVEQNTSFIWLLLAVLAGTAFLLLILKLNIPSLWKLWYLLAMFFALAFAFAAFLPQLAAGIIAAAAAAWKTFRPNALVHNLTEVFVYGGLAAAMVPLLNIFSATILLVGISVYDAYAVWKSKHMIKLAKFQQQSKVFAGLYLPYRVPKKRKTTTTAAAKGKPQTAILGGGDMAFPLLFAGVVMRSFGFNQALLVSLFAAAALGLLFVFSRKGRFYPAMPFISAGCFLAYGILLLRGT